MHETIAKAAPKSSNADGLHIQADFTYNDSVSQFAIPTSRFLQDNPQYTHVATGAFVFHDDQLLIVQRAADEKGFGANLWEVPGGQVDSEDPTILHGLQRELFEEAGLRCKRVLYQLGHGNTFTSGKQGEKKWFKQSFVVQVENDDPLGPPKITLDPVEHQAYLWITEAELLAGKTEANGTVLNVTSPAQLALKKDAFRLYREKTAAIS